MADPRRYYIEPVLVTQDGVPPRATTITEPSPSGDWVKWADFQDYKAGQTRNKSEDTVSKLGMEIVALRIRLQEMEKAGNRLAKAAKRLAKTDYEDGEGIDTLLKNWEESKNA